MNWVMFNLLMRSQGTNNKLTMRYFVLCGGHFYTKLEKMSHFCCYASFCKVNQTISGPRLYVRRTAAVSLSDAPGGSPCSFSTNHRRRLAEMYLPLPEEMMLRVIWLLVFVQSQRTTLGIKT